jgi:hypothetical protein
MPVIHSQPNRRQQLRCKGAAALVSLILVIGGAREAFGEEDNSALFAAATSAYLQCPTKSNRFRRRSDSNRLRPTT